MTGRRALAGRGGLAGGWGFAGRERLTRPHPSGGWHGLMGRPADRARRPPARAGSRDRLCADRVSGPRRRPHAANRRPGLARPAVRCATRRRRPERLASSLRPGRPDTPRRVVEPGGPGRSGGAGRARIARNIDQAARRIHGRRVQHPLALATRPRRRRRTAPVTGRPAAGRPAASSGPEKQQGNQANRETRYGQRRAQAGDMAAGALSGDHEDPARHDHHGADHRQGGGKPHPPGTGGIRAHRSTIASWFAPRKPYGQVRPSRLAFSTIGAVSSPRAAAVPRVRPAIRYAS